MSTQQFMNPSAGPVDRAARLGLWALPVWAALLFAGTLTYQPSPKTHLADWSRYVNTPQFLASHLVASILGAGIGALGTNPLRGQRVLEEIRSRREGHHGVPRRRHRTRAGADLALLAAGCHD